MKNRLSGAVLVVLTSMAQATLAEDGAKPAPISSNLTLGVIQRLIKAGMSSSEVVEAVGSPNLVTRGRNGRESWVYDRFSTETEEKGVHVGGGGLAGGSSVLGVLGLNGGASKKTTSQRTLMLVVTFGADSMVDTFTYRSSKF